MVIAFQKSHLNTIVSLALLVSRYFFATLKKALGTTGLTLALSHRSRSNCSKSAINILHAVFTDLYQYSSHPRIEIDAPLEDVVASLFPVFSLAVDLPEQLHSNVSLIKTSLHSLYIDHRYIKEPSLDNAIAILFQGGYLSIKEVLYNDAYLGLANHEVAYSLATFLIGETQK